MTRKTESTFENISQLYMYCLGLSVVEPIEFSEGSDSSLNVKIYPKRLADYGVTIIYNLSTGYFHCCSSPLAIDTSQYAIVEAQNDVLQLPVYILREVKQTIEQLSQKFSLSSRKVSSKPTSTLKRRKRGDAR